MSQIKATFTGSVVAAPEARAAGSSNLVEFPVYVNHQKKNRDTQVYEKTGDVSKVKVTLWGDMANSSEVEKGDLVEVTATLVEKTFQKRDGTEGRALQTDYVEAVVIKAKSNRPETSSGDCFAPSGGGF